MAKHRALAFQRKPKLPKPVRKRPSMATITQRYFELRRMRAIVLKAEVDAR